MKQQLESLSQAQEIQRVTASSAALMKEATAAVVPTTTTTFVYGSLGVCEGLLNEATQDIYRLATEIATMAISRQRYDWLLSQLFGVLHEIFSRKTILERGGCGKVVLQSLSFGQHTEDGDNRGRASESPMALRTSARRLLATKSFGLVEAVSVEVKADRRRMHLTFLEYQPTTPSATSQPSESFTQCRLYIETPSTAPSAGCIFQVCELRGPRCQLFKTLSTYSIHPRKSLVFEHLKKGNTEAVRKMLSHRAISPNDRDEDGNTLLWVRFYTLFPAPPIPTS